MRKTLAPVLVAVTLAGCIPGRVSEVSEVTGALRHGGAPAASVTVVWEDRNPNDPALAVRETQTDSLGLFSFEGRTRWGMWILLPVHGLVNWRIQFRHGDTLHSVRLWEYGPQWPPERVRFECDLQRQEEFCRIVEPAFFQLDSMSVVVQVDSAGAK